MSEMHRWWPWPAALRAPVLVAAAVLTLTLACGPSKPEPGDRPIEPQVGAGGAEAVPEAEPADDLGEDPTAAGTAGGVEEGAGRDPNRLIPEIAVTNPEGEPMPIEGRVFLAGERFRIENVPAGVTFHLVGVDPPTWEVRDAEGARLALIQEEEWSEAMKPETRQDDTAPLRAGTPNDPVEIEDWGGEPATLVTTQVNTTLRLYRIERRSEGTDWIRKGFRYEPTRVGVQEGENE